MALVLVMSGACDRAETSNAAVTTTSPAGSATAPAAAAADSRNEALVRVVHAVPAGMSFDLFAGDLVLFDGIGFKTVSAYRALDGTRHAFALRPAGIPTAKPLSTNTEGLNDGAYYTAFALPGDGREPVLRVVGDNLTAPASGRARVRIVHAGAGAGEIDVYASGAGEALFDGVDFQSITEYRDISPVAGGVDIRPAGKATPLLALPSARIAAGRFYTIVVTGRTRASPPLEAFIIEDALTPAGATR